MHDVNSRSQAGYCTPWRKRAETKTKKSSYLGIWESVMAQETSWEDSEEEKEKPWLMIMKGQRKLKVTPRVKKTTRGVNERKVARCRMQIELSRARSKFCLSRFRGGRNLDESASLEECGCFEEGEKKTWSNREQLLQCMHICKEAAILQRDTSEYCPNEPVRPIIHCNSFVIQCGHMS